MRPPAYYPPVNPLGWVLPADGGGPVSPDAAPKPLDVPFSQALSALNPLHHVPVLGRIYRAETGDEIPEPLKILGAGILGGPLGILGAAFTSLLTEIIAMGPDTSRPPAPVGMSVTGSEVAMQPVTPGTAGKDEYLTLATTLPEWLRPSTAEQLAMVGDPRRGMDAYQAAAGTRLAQALPSGAGQGQG